MLTLSDISIFYFYFKDIHNERTQVWVEGLWGMACFNDFILFVKVRTGEKVGLLAEYLPYDGPILLFLECVQHDACVIYPLLSSFYQI